MIDDLLEGDDATRQAILAGLPALPEHVRGALAIRLIPLAREAAEGPDQAALDLILPALARLRVDSAKNYLLRLADEESVVSKTALVRALRGTDTTVTRAVFLHLLSDESMQIAAVTAIGEAPWAGVLPDLIELAESDDGVAKVALAGIVRCAAHGADDAQAAYDFLLELLADPVLKHDARAALDELHRSEML